MGSSGVEGRSTAKGVYPLFLGNVTATSLMALGSIVVARLLGPDLYGLYGLALVTPGYVLSLIQLAVPSAQCPTAGGERVALSLPKMTSPLAPKLRTGTALETRVPAMRMILTKMM